MRRKRKEIYFLRLVITRAAPVAPNKVRIPMSGATSPVCGRFPAGVEGLEGLLEVSEGVDESEVDPEEVSSITRSVCIWIS